MTWRIRREDEHVDPVLSYDTEGGEFTLKFNHGGRINYEDGSNSYIGGKVLYVDFCDADTFSLHDLNYFLKSLHYPKDVIVVYVYLDPQCGYGDGLRELTTDAHLRQFLSWARRFKVLEIFAHHSTEEEINQLFSTEPKVTSSVVIEEIEDDNVLEPSVVTIGPSRVKDSEVGADKLGNNPLLCLNDSDCEIVNCGAEYDDVGNESVINLEAGNDDNIVNNSEIFRDRYEVENGGDDTAENDDDDVSEVGADKLGNAENDDEDSLNDVVNFQVRTDVEDDTDDITEGDDDSESHYDDVDANYQVTRNEEAYVAAASRRNSSEKNRRRIDRDEDVNEESCENSRLSHMFEPANIQKDLQQNYATKGSWNEMDSGEDDDYDDRSGDNDDQDGDDEEMEAAEIIDRAENEALRSQQYNYVDYVQVKDKAPIFHIGLKFGSKKDFREAVTLYSIYARRPVKLVRNTKNIMRAKCVPPCKWHVYVKHIKALNPHDYVCYSHREEHNECSQAWENRRLTSRWLSKKYMEKFRANPDMPISSIRQNVDEQFKCEISRSKAYKTKRKALEMIQGTAEEQYRLLYDYREELLRTHPDATIEIEFRPRSDENSRCRFLRWYSCLGPLKSGWKRVCRPIIFMDGCFTKGIYKGQILTALGIDPNNGIWPIAWAVVEKEARAQWKWFIKLLTADLNIEDSCHWTFMSDQHKGLGSVIAELFPNVEHRNCALHIWRNLKKDYPGKQMKQFFWEIAFSTNHAYFENAMKELEKFNEKAYNRLKTAAEPKSWVKAFYSSHTKCDTNVNNISESFNALIVEAREKTILSMLDDIRYYVMKRIKEYGSWMRKYEGIVTPAIKAIVDENIQRSREWEPICNGHDGFEVKGPGFEQFVVYLGKKTCSCGAWMLSGIPCCHAIACIHRWKQDPISYVDKCYSRDEYLNLYSHVLQPLNGREMCVKE